MVEALDSVMKNRKTYTQTQDVMDLRVSCHGVHMLIG